MNWPIPGGLGGLLAIIVLLLVIMFAFIGKMALLPAVLFGMLALAILTLARPG